MSVQQFLTILWARRMVVVITTVSCLLGAIIVLLIAPPRYTANARVLLNLLHPDPASGMVINTQSTATYIRTQIQLIQDYPVAGVVVDKLGLQSEPTLIQQYAKSDKKPGWDFRRWLAQRIIDGTKPTNVPGTNILEIDFADSDPDRARLVAETLRQAYIDSSLATARDDARRTAEWYEGQAEQERRLLAAADEAKANYEKQTGIVLKDDKEDIETARLNALVNQAGPVMATAPAMAASNGGSGSAQLAAIDAEIAQNALTLGPNHPKMQELKARRASLSAAIARDPTGAVGEAGRVSSSMINSALEQQKTRVIAQHGELERLKMLQAEVDLRREQLDKTLGKAAELSQQADVAETGISLMGPVVTPQKPDFPNKPLILGGSIGLGMVMGLVLSVLLELLGRRVRTPADMRAAVEAPLLAVIGAPVNEPRASRFPSLFGRLRPQGGV
jgi:uncharacterized protein involved in exopolysaccharide biosynthesis